MMATEIILANGERITDQDRIAEYMAVAQAEVIVAVAAKGHDCWENPVHYLLPSGRDAYDCGICGDLLQVG
jgi:hypothetical protein